MAYHKLIKIYMCDSSINARSKEKFWLVQTIWETHYGATQMHTQPQCCESICGQVCLWINLGGIVFIYALTPAVFAN